MTKTPFLITFLILSFSGQAQFSDNFGDGDFKSNPEWIGNDADFFINADFQLQSANKVASSTFYITTANRSVLETQWEFWMKIDFNPSSANYVDVWLASEKQELDNPSNSGYFVRIGSTDDDICLYKKTGSQAAVKIIDGRDGILNKSASVLKIKVIRTSDNHWILLRDIGGSGTRYLAEGKSHDADINTSSHFGIFIKQSTASFFQKHFFDDFEVTRFAGIPHVRLVSIKAVTNNSLEILFDQPLLISTAETVSNYHTAGIGHPVHAALDEADGSKVILTFDTEFIPNQKHSLIIDGVEDIFGNSLSSAQFDFYHYKANRYEVVISEIFADPSPTVELPSQKFIELKNTADFPFNLKNWQLRDGGNTATLPSVELLPDSFLIVTTGSGEEAYKPYGKTISVSNFPTLYVSGGQVELYDDGGRIIHAMKYDLSYYKNELKKQGGFSLEMINTKNGCGGTENWIASRDLSGGTPGRKNSVNEETVTEQKIKIINAYLSERDTLFLVFNKTIDSLQATDVANYKLSDGLNVQAASTISPFFNTVKLHLGKELDDNKIYRCDIKNISDCVGSGIEPGSHRLFGLTSTPGSQDIIINEILFDPKPGGVDYVELYNKSGKIIDISKLFVANRNSGGQPANFIVISEKPKDLLPSEYLLLTTDIAATLKDYPLGNDKVFFKITSLPSFPDDAGTALIMDQQSNIIDEVNYNKNWHFSLIKDREGVSLERISFEGPSDKSNFHSASSISGYGTPGYKNSQSKNEDGSTGTFRITPEIFSPDNDGIDDFLTIHYEFESPGYLTNVKIYDMQGRMVRYLQQNSLSGIKGYYRWDGLDDKNQKLSQGIYVIHFESFNEAGKKVQYKRSVVLARRWR